MYNRYSDDMNFSEDFLEKIFDRFDDIFDNIDEYESHSSGWKHISSDLIDCDDIDFKVKTPSNYKSNYIKSKQAKTYNGFYEEPVTPVVKHVATEKPKEKCIIKRILNIFYKDKKNEQ